MKIRWSEQIMLNTTLSLKFLKDISIALSFPIMFSEDFPNRTYKKSYPLSTWQLTTIKIAKGDDDRISKDFPSKLYTTWLKRLLYKLSGELLVTEIPYSSILLPEYYNSHCQSCFHRILAPIPCWCCARVSFYHVIVSRIYESESLWKDEY